MDAIRKLSSAAKRIGKYTPKVIGGALPAVSVGASALSAWNESGGDPETALKKFGSKFIPINFATGEFDTKRLKEGLLPLGISAVVGYGLNELSKMIR